MLCHGNVTLSIIDKDKVIFTDSKANTITNNGLLSLFNSLITDTPFSFKYIQIGTGGSLENGVLKNVQFDENSLYAYYKESIATTSVIKINNGYKISFYSEIPIPVDVNVNEIGLFNNPYTEDNVMMFAKQTFLGTVDRILKREYEPIGENIIFRIKWEIFLLREESGKL